MNTKATLQDGRQAHGAGVIAVRKPARWRRVLFQVHLWSGVGLSLYIIFICLSGSAVVFRRELDRLLCGRSCEPRFITGLTVLHDDLAGGRIGRWLNGGGAVAVLLLCLSGLILWWPGAGRLRRGMTVRPRLPWPGLIRDLHHALGFWLALPVLMWAMTGIYFAFPDPFESLGDLFTDAGVPAISVEDDINWIVRLHFGRAFGPGIEALWTLFGLLPVALVVTGLMMWWHRTWRNRMRHTPATLPPAARDSAMNP